MDSARIFLITGVLRRATMSGGWVPLSVLLVVELDFSALQLMLMGTAIESAILLAEVPTGVVADVYSRKWSVIIGTFILGAAQFTSGLMSHWPAFLVTQFVWGVGWTFLSGAEIAWITDRTGSADDAEPLILRRARWQFFAIVFGTLLFAGIGWGIGLRFAVLLAGSAGMLWSVALIFLMEEGDFERAVGDRVEQMRRTVRDGGRHTWRRPGLRVLAGLMLIGGMAAEAVDRSNLRRLEDLGLSASLSPTLVFAAVVIANSLLAGGLLALLEDRFSGPQVVPAFAALFVGVGLGVVALGLVPVLGVAIVLLIVQGGLLALTDPLIVTWTNALARADIRATVHSFIGLMRAAGEILGGLVLGAVAALTSLPAALVCSGLLFLVGGMVAPRARSDFD